MLGLMIGLINQARNEVTGRSRIPLVSDIEENSCPCFVCTRARQLRDACPLRMWTTKQYVAATLNDYFDKYYEDFRGAFVTFPESRRPAPIWPPSARNTLRSGDCELETNTGSNDHFIDAIKYTFSAVSASGEESVFRPTPRLITPAELAPFDARDIGPSVPIERYAPSWRERLIEDLKRTRIPAVEDNRPPKIEIVVDPALKDETQWYLNAEASKDIPTFERKVGMNPALFAGYEGGKTAFKQTYDYADAFKACFPQPEPADLTDVQKIIEEARQRLEAEVMRALILITPVGRTIDLKCEVTAKWDIT